LCNEGAEVASKCLKVNEFGAYFDSSFLVTPTTFGTQSTPITPGSEDTHPKKGVGYSA